VPNHLSVGRTQRAIGKRVDKPAENEAEHFMNRPHMQQRRRKKQAST
jgi:hypothetical protein